VREFLFWIEKWGHYAEKARGARLWLLKLRYFLVMLREGSPPSFLSNFAVELKVFVSLNFF
jgi:hypothetical protein